jgi:hypothetical protein
MQRFDARTARDQTAAFEPATERDMEFWGNLSNRMNEFLIV